MMDPYNTANYQCELTQPAPVNNLAASQFKSYTSLFCVFSMWYKHAVLLGWYSFINAVECRCVTLAGGWSRWGWWLSPSSTADESTALSCPVVSGTQTVRRNGSSECRQLLSSLKYSYRSVCVCVCMCVCMGVWVGWDWGRKNRVREKEGEERGGEGGGACMVKIIN